MATRYFIERFDQPGKEGQPIAVYRWVDGEVIRTERYDTKSGKWVHDPSLLEATGIGGAESFDQVTEKEARDTMAALSGRETE